MKKSAVIKKFLEFNTHVDLWLLYSSEMEVQVNVAPDGGDRVEADYKGRQYQGWTDGVTTWKSFRIPWNARTKPEYEDKELNWDFDSHVEGIGLTGWDWKNLISRYVGFDFDAILGHKSEHRKKLTPDELEEARQAAWNLPYTTIRKSTSGKGLHVYVPLSEMETETHTEHAALARSVIGKMSADTGYDFSSRVDVCGQILWIWHRKMIGTDGLTLLKEADENLEPPPNWRDHVEVIKGKRKKSLPGFVSEAEVDVTLTFEDLASSVVHVPLDDDHKKLIKYLGDRCTWCQDQHMLITHTVALKSAHVDLGLKGIFETISPGTNQNEQNCFLFPLSGGSWAVRRYTPA